MDSIYEWDVFVAYCMADRRHAGAIHESLQACSRAFLAEHDLESGDFTKQLHRAQERARMTVALVSEESWKSPYWVAEIQHAFNLYRSRTSERRHQVLPVLLDELPIETLLPPPLTKFDAIGFADFRGYDALAAAILACLQGVEVHPERRHGLLRFPPGPPVIEKIPTTLAVGIASLCHRGPAFELTVEKANELLRTQDPCASVLQLSHLPPHPEDDDVESWAAHWHTVLKKAGLCGPRTLESLVAIFPESELSEDARHARNELRATLMAAWRMIDPEDIND